MIDWDFIAAREGDRLTGYVPLDATGRPLGHSGVTVGDGVDLGQMSYEQIQQLKLPPSLTLLLLPYADVRGDDAGAFLAQLPLTLSAEQAALLNRAVWGVSAAALTWRYDAARGRSGCFAALPAAAQTAIASVAYQYGDLGRKCPRFWRCAVAEDWAGAAAELEHFGDAYAPRRRLEADLLKPLIPAPATPTVTA